MGTCSCGTINPRRESARSTHCLLLFRLWLSIVMGRISRSGPPICMKMESKQSINLAEGIKHSVVEPAVFIKSITSKDISKQSSVFIKQTRRIPSFDPLFPDRLSAIRNRTGMQKCDYPTSHTPSDPSQMTPDSS